MKTAADSALCWDASKGGFKPRPDSQPIDFSIKLKCQIITLLGLRDRACSCLLILGVSPSCEPLAPGVCRVFTPRQLLCVCLCLRSDEKSGPQAACGSCSIPSGTHGNTVPFLLSCGKPCDPSQEQSTSLGRWEDQLNGHCGPVARLRRWKSTSPAPSSV